MRRCEVLVWVTFFAAEANWVRFSALDQFFEASVFALLGAIVLLIHFHFQRLAEGRTVVVIERLVAEPANSPATIEPAQRPAHPVRL